MLEKKWIILLLLTQYFFCNAQQEIITSYQDKKFQNLNIVLKGKVKNVKQISYSPNKLCDTIPSSIDDAFYKNIRSGEIILIKCSCDTIIYCFDNELSPKKIKYIYFQVDETNRRTLRETIYLFEKGNLISEISSRNGKVLNETVYKYDLNNNLIVKTEDLSSVIMIDSLEYDKNNNLIKECTYRYALKKSYFKKIKGQYILKKNKKFILDSTLYNSEVYEYDSFNHLISKTWSNNRIKNIYIYDTLGNKIEEGRCENYKGDVCEYSPSKGFVYDKNNRIIKTFIIGNWKPNNSDTYYQYDEHGREIEVKGFDIYYKKDTVIGYHWIYEYDEHGQQVKKESLKGGSFSFYHSDMVKINYKKLITTYDNFKNITKQEYYSATNKIRYVICYIYTYDSYGNWIKVEEFSGKNEDELVKTNIKERKLEYY